MPRRFVLILAVMVMVVGLLPIRPAIPVSGAAEAPLASLAAIVFPGADTPTDFGVYLGHGLVLTNWHPWTAAGQGYLDSAPPSPAREVPEYDADGVADPGERALDMADCDGTLTPLDEAGADCTPLTRIEGASFAFPLAGTRAQAGPDAGALSGAAMIPVRELVYASQKYDIALFAVDAAAVEKLGVPAARLTMVSTGADFPVRIASLDAVDGLAAALRSGDPVLLPATDTPAMPGPWRVESLVAAEVTAPAGSPVFAAESGDLIGLAWRGDAGETWITPAAAWIHALYAANDQIGSQRLAGVLVDAVAAPVDAPPTIGDPLIPTLGNAGIDVLHVTLKLDLDPDAGTIAGVATLHIRAVYDQLASFNLDAYGLDIQDVQIGGASVPFVAKEHKLVIELPAPLAYGAEFDAAITYQAAPQPYHSAYIPYFDVGMLHRDGRLFTYNEPDAAHTWFPCNDHPRDRATYDFYLRTAMPDQAIANGTLLDTTDNGDGTRTYHWQMPYPMASYLAEVAVGEYTVVADKTPDGISVKHYVYPGQEATARTVFSYSDDALVMLRGFFGPYPFDAYGHIVVPHQGVAIETQTLTTLPDGVLDSTEEGVYVIMVHEMAHQWIGNAVPLASWSDMWLKEGLATYVEWLAQAQRYGNSAATAARSTSEQTLLTDRRTSSLIAPATGDLLGVASYDKGAWVFQMLRQEIGDEAFFNLLRATVTTFTDRPISTLDFWRLAEEVSGQNLDAFFTQWLLRGGIPNLTLYWSATDAGADVLLCANAATDYRFALPLRFGDGTRSMDAALDVAPGEQRVSLPFDFAPMTLAVDPDQLVLAQVQVQQIAALPDACAAVE
ncbi:M1 family metallopeptidase [Aggregatilinea lenta]|uniref:M1 family metallopeptidase n=1 Tax=Aggregatilinea lenta TaxID=913108 RepID=UPI0013C3167A|nr:M1 family metallopeptidase [Aggregatilinea lenta]